MDKMQTFHFIHFFQFSKENLQNAPKKVKILHFLPLVAKIWHLGIKLKIKKKLPEAHISARLPFGNMQHGCVGWRPTHPGPPQGLGFFGAYDQKILVL